MLGPESLEQLALRIDLRGAMLEADLSLPVGARGLVLFAHGSGSSRLVSLEFDFGPAHAARYASGRQSP